MFYNPNTGQFSIYLPDVTVMAERGTSHVIFSQNCLIWEKLTRFIEANQTQLDGVNRLNIKHAKKTFMRKMSSNHRIDFNFRRTGPKISRSPPGSAW